MAIFQFLNQFKQIQYDGKSGGGGGYYDGKGNYIFTSEVEPVPQPFVPPAIIQPVPQSAPMQTNSYNNRYQNYEDFENYQYDPDQQAYTPVIQVSSAPAPAPVAMQNQPANLAASMVVEDYGLSTAPSQPLTATHAAALSEPQMEDFYGRPDGRGTNYNPYEPDIEYLQTAPAPAASQVPGQRPSIGTSMVVKVPTDAELIQQLTVVEDSYYDSKSQSPIIITPGYTPDAAAVAAAKHKSILQQQQEFALSLSQHYGLTNDDRDSLVRIMMSDTTLTAAKAEEFIRENPTHYSHYFERYDGALAIAKLIGLSDEMRGLVEVAMIARQDLDFIGMTNFIDRHPTDWPDQLILLLKKADSVAAFDQNSDLIADRNNATAPVVYGSGIAGLTAKQVEWKYEKTFDQYKATVDRNDQSLWSMKSVVVGTTEEWQNYDGKGGGWVEVPVYANRLSPPDDVDLHAHYVNFFGNPLEKMLGRSFNAYWQNNDQYDGKGGTIPKPATLQFISTQRVAVDRDNRYRDIQHNGFHEKVEAFHQNGTFNGVSWRDLNASLVPFLSGPHYIARQLLDISKKAGFSYNVPAGDKLIDLSIYLDSIGIKDATQIYVENGRYVDRSTGRDLGEYVAGNAFCYTALGDGWTDFVPQVLPSGQVIFIPKWADNSDLGTIITIVAIALAFTGAGAAIGAGLLSGVGVAVGAAGSISAIAATALGGAIISTGLTAIAGGDVSLKSFGKSFAMGMVGGGVSSFISGLGGVAGIAGISELGTVGNAVNTAVTAGLASGVTSVIFGDSFADGFVAGAVSSAASQAGVGLVSTVNAGLGLNISTAGVAAAGNFIGNYAVTGDLGQAAVSAAGAYASGVVSTQTFDDGSKIETMGDGTIRAIDTAGQVYVPGSNPNLPQNIVPPQVIKFDDGSILTIASTGAVSSVDSSGQNYVPGSNPNLPQNQPAQPVAPQNLDPNRAVKVTEDGSGKKVVEFANGRTATIEVTPEGEKLVAGSYVDQKGHVHSVNDGVAMITDPTQNDKVLYFKNGDVEFRVNASDNATVVKVGEQVFLRNESGTLLQSADNASKVVLTYNEAGLVVHAATLDGKLMTDAQREIAHQAAITSGVKGSVEINREFDDEGNLTISYSDGRRASFMGKDFVHGSLLDKNGLEYSLAGSAIIVKDLTLTGNQIVRVEVDGKTTYQALEGGRAMFNTNGSIEIREADGTLIQRIDESKKIQYTFSKTGQLLDARRIDGATMSLADREAAFKVARETNSVAYQINGGPKEGGTVVAAFTRTEAIEKQFGKDALTEYNKMGDSQRNYETFIATKLSQPAIPNIPFDPQSYLTNQSAGSAGTSIGFGATGSTPAAATSLNLGAFVNGSFGTTLNSNGQFAPQAISVVNSSFPNTMAPIASSVLDPRTSFAGSAISGMTFEQFSSLQADMKITGQTIQQLGLYDDGVRTNNAAVGALATAATTVGSFVQGVARFAEHWGDRAELAVPLSGLSEHQIKNENQLQVLFNIADSMNRYGQSLGYAASTNLSDLKSGNPLTVLQFIGERLVTSAPQMALAILNPQSLFVSTSNSTLNTRLELQGISLDQAQWHDYTIAAGTAFVATYLERMALTKNLSPAEYGTSMVGSLFHAGTRESVTEVLQTALEVVGGQQGTGVNLLTLDNGARLLEAAIVGFGSGPAINGGATAVNRFTNAITGGDLSSSVQASIFQGGMGFAPSTFASNFMQAPNVTIATLDPATQGFSISNSAMNNRIEPVFDFPDVQPAMTPFTNNISNRVPSSINTPNFTITPIAMENSSIPNFGVRPFEGSYGQTQALFSGNPVVNQNFGTSFPFMPAVSNMNQPGFNQPAIAPEVLENLTMAPLTMGSSTFVRGARFEQPVVEAPVMDSNGQPSVGSGTESTMDPNSSNSPAAILERAFSSNWDGLKLNSSAILSNVADLSGQQGVSHLKLQTGEINGTKVFIKTGSETLNDLRNGEASGAEIEAYWYKALSEMNIGPKFFGVDEVTINGKTHPVLITEFVQGTHLQLNTIGYYSGPNSLDIRNQILKIGQTLDEAGISPVDLQFRVTDAGKVVVIDPELFTLQSPDSSLTGAQMAQQYVDRLIQSENRASSVVTAQSLFDSLSEAANYSSNIRLSIEIQNGAQRLMSGGFNAAIDTIADARMAIGEGGAEAANAKIYLGHVRDQMNEISKAADVVMSHTQFVKNEIESDGFVTTVYDSGNGQLKISVIDQGTSRLRVDLDIIDGAKTTTLRVYVDGTLDRSLVEIMNEIRPSLLADSNQSRTVAKDIESLLARNDFESIQVQPQPGNQQNPVSIFDDPYVRNFERGPDSTVGSFESQSMPGIKYETVQRGFTRESTSYESVFKNTDGTEIGRIEYEVDGNLIDLDLTLVPEAFRQQGINMNMFRDILAQHPNVNGIRAGNLIDVNLEKYTEAFEAARALGKSPAEAMRLGIENTPRYKSNMNLGFTELEFNPMNSGTPEFVMRKPDISVAQMMDPASDANLDGIHVSGLSPRFINEIDAALRSNDDLSSSFRTIEQTTARVTRDLENAKSWNDLVTHRDAVMAEVEAKYRILRVDINHPELQGKANGVAVGQDVIYVNTALSLSQEFSVILHELNHLQLSPTGANLRINSSIDGLGTGRSYGDGFRTDEIKSSSIDFATNAQTIAAIINRTDLTQVVDESFLAMQNSIARRSAFVNDIERTGNEVLSSGITVDGLYNVGQHTVAFTRDGITTNTVVNKWMYEIKNSGLGDHPTYFEFTTEPGLTGAQAADKFKEFIQGEMNSLNFYKVRLADDIAYLNELSSRIEAARFNNGLDVAEVDDIDFSQFFNQPNSTGIDPQVSIDSFQFADTPNSSFAAQAGLSDSELVDAFRQRILTSAGGNGQAALEKLDLNGLAARPLSGSEREILAFLQSPEGLKVDIRIHAISKDDNSNGSLRPETDGTYLAEFGLTPLDGRSPFEMAKHEISHVIDGVLAYKGAPHLKGYIFPDEFGRGSNHNIVYQELRANLFGFDGDFERAWEVTKKSYAQGNFWSGSSWDITGLTGREAYDLMNALVKNVGSSRLWPGSDDAVMMSVIADLNLQTKFPELYPDFNSGTAMNMNVRSQDAGLTDADYRSTLSVLAYNNPVANPFSHSSFNGSGYVSGGGIRASTEAMNEAAEALRNKDYNSVEQNAEGARTELVNLRSAIDMSQDWDSSRFEVQQSISDDVRIFSNGVSTIRIVDADHGARITIMINSTENKVGHKIEFNTAEVNPSVQNVIDSFKQEGQNLIPVVNKVISDAEALLSIVRVERAIAATPVQMAEQRIINDFQSSVQYLDGRFQVGHAEGQGLAWFDANGNPTVRVNALAGEVQLDSDDLQIIGWTPQATAVARHEVAHVQDVREAANAQGQSPNLMAFRDSSGEPFFRSEINSTVTTLRAQLNGFIDALVLRDATTASRIYAEAPAVLRELEGYIASIGHADRFALSQQGLELMRSSLVLDATSKPLNPGFVRYKYDILDVNGVRVSLSAEVPSSSTENSAFALIKLQHELGLKEVNAIASALEDSVDSSGKIVIGLRRQVQDLIVTADARGLDPIHTDYSLKFKSDDEVGSGVVMHMNVQSGSQAAASEQNDFLSLLLKGDVRTAESREPQVEVTPTIAPTTQELLAAAEARYQTISSNRNSNPVDRLIARLERDALTQQLIDSNVESNRDDFLALLNKDFRSSNEGITVQSNPTAQPILTVEESQKLAARARQMVQNGETSGIDMLLAQMRRERTVEDIVNELARQALGPSPAEIQRIRDLKSELDTANQLQILVDPRLQALDKELYSIERRYRPFNAQERQIFEAVVEIPRDTVKLTKAEERYIEDIRKAVYGPNQKSQLFPDDVQAIEGVNKLLQQIAQNRANVVSDSKNALRAINESSSPQATVVPFEFEKAFKAKFSMSQRTYHDGYSGKSIDVLEAMVKLVKMSPEQAVSNSMFQYAQQFYYSNIVTSSGALRNTVQGNPGIEFFHLRMEQLNRIAEIRELNVYNDIPKPI